MSEGIFGGFDSVSSFDDTLDVFMAKVALEGEICALKHGPESMGLPEVQAVDYLCQNLGNNETGEVTEQLRIPICKECKQGLMDPDWALIYCVTCHKSQWIYKPRSDYNFHSDVVWLNVCPFCKKTEENI